MMLEKELVTVKKGFEDKRRVDKGLIAYLKKKKRITIEWGWRLKIKNRLTNLNIEEERSLRAEYKA